MRVSKVAYLQIIKVLSVEATIGQLWNRSIVEQVCVYVWL